MQALEQIQARLKSTFPNAWFGMALPEGQGQYTWLTIFLDENVGVISHHNKTNEFALSYNSNCVYGQGQDESYTDMEIVISRMTELIETAGSTAKQA